MMTVMCQKW